MKNSTEMFFQQMVGKLSILNEDVSKVSFLEDICRFFDISHAFVFESDHLGVFARKEYFEITNRRTLPDRLDMKEILGLELLSELCSRKVVICTGECEKDALELRLCEIFLVRTMVFIPILNQHYELAGFVGLGDCRRDARDAKENIGKACSLLNLLANTIKLEMFQKGIANAEAAMSNVLDHIGIDIYVNDYYTHDVLYANKSMAAPYGGVEGMMGKKCWQALFDDKDGPCEFCPQPRLLDEKGRLNKTYQWDYERPFDKSWFRVLSSSFPWSDGRIAHLVASVDITESKRNQMLIENLAKYDYLTGLSNRRSLHDDVQNFIEDTELFGEKWYLLFCDLDGFKSVNDSLGHEAGDVLLIEMAESLKAECSADLRAYRQGGDEFVVLLRDNDDNEKLRQTVDMLLGIFSKRYDYKGQSMGCGCSIGVAHYPVDALNAKEIFRLADTAMYCVKQEGRGTVRFYYDCKFVDMETYFQLKKEERR